MLRSCLFLSCFMMALGCGDEPTDTDPGTDGGGGAGGATSASSSSSSQATGGPGSGGSNPGAICDATPCGGDILGSWRYEEPCGSTPWMEEACGGTPDLVRRTRYVYRVEGDVTFGADGHVSITKQAEAGWEFEIPLMCLGFANCAQAVQGDGVTCAEEGDTCFCSSVAAGPVESAIEPFQTNGTQIVFGEGSEAATLDYCVAGSQAKLVHPETAEATFLGRD